MNSRKDELISSLNLRPHPEGGYFAETYRSEGFISRKTGQFPDGRTFCTAIYYLLGSGDVSCFHRIRSDEIWHHYEGAPLTIHLLRPDGAYQKLHLGKNPGQSRYPQQVVPAETWFGVTVDTPESFSLCGCTVSPGFDFGDFEMADREQLLQHYPRQQEIIEKLTGPSR